MRPNRKYSLLLLVIAAVGATAYVFISTAAQSTSSWPFANVTASQLASQGVTLSPVAAPAALTTSATGAANAASTFQGGNQALVQPQYMHCVDTTREPALDQDCWVVSIDPAGMTAPGGAVAGTVSSGASSIPIQYDIVFIDPSNGKVIEATLG